MDKFFFFWSNKSIYSQWHKAFFTIDDFKFNCAEQYMMYQKAKLFGDFIAVAKILNTSNPARHKEFGRQVKNFDKKVWEENCERIVYEGNFAKFTQNPALLEELLSTEGKLLVEASPYDEIWGIGLSEEDAKKTTPDKWPGRNLLGKILTKVREDIIDFIRTGDDNE